MSKITPQGHVLGWSRDLPDHRDYLYSAPASVLATLPSSVDLRSQMPAVYDQGVIGCHDEKTEVLTDTGWKLWSDLSGNELLGTMHQSDGMLEFQQPTALHRYDYDGPLYYSDHRSLDFALTPNHRMYVRPWNEHKRTLDSNYNFSTMENLGWYAGLPCTTHGHKGVGLRSLEIGNRVWDGNDFLNLIALVISDGWVGGTEDNRNSVSFCCFREDRLPIVRDLAAKLGLHEIPKRPGVWKWDDPELAAWLRANAYAGSNLRSPNKRIPEIVKSATSEQISTFLNYYGDQHVNSAGRRHFYSSSHRLASDLQELLLRTGRRASLYERAPRDTTMADGRQIFAENCTKDITIVERKSDRLSIERKHNLQIDYYKGPVYCATVPNSLLVTRRNDSILISGNSCTANSIAGAVEFDRLKTGHTPDFVPSRLFIYFNERSIERTVPLDAGAMIRDGIQTVATKGVCPETDWPYIATPADPTTNLFPPGSPPRTVPPSSAYGAAWHYKALTYSRVTQSLTQLKGCLAEGFPFVFGFSVYSNIYDVTGNPVTTLNLPASTDELLGGHAVLAVGYDDTSQTFIVRNSWGPNVQVAGYFYMAYNYLTDTQLTSDIWTIRSESA